MKISYAFRQMDSSEGLKDHTSQKLARLARFEEREMSIQVTFQMERYQRSVELQVTGSYGVFVSSETREDMYEAIDLAIDKLDRQLSRNKSKRKHHKGNQPATPQNIG